jgi:L-threonylcarbamoyladenylate synthase
MDTPSPPEKLIATLRAGGIIAYPTEAVWGLGCDPYNQLTVQRLLTLKQRTVEKGLIVIAAGLNQLHPLLDLSSLPSGRLSDLLATWPGPNTWVIPASRQAPAWITGAHATIAVRISAHPVVVALCNAFGGPLVSSSANLSGEPPAYRFDQLSPAMRAGVDAISEGETGGLKQPTTIRDAVTGRILRG